MTYQHIAVSLPPVPMGQQFDEPFKQTPEAEQEYAMALAAPELLDALQGLVDWAKSCANSDAPLSAVMWQSVMLKASRAIDQATPK